MKNILFGLVSGIFVFVWYDNGPEYSFAIFTFYVMWSLFETADSTKNTDVDQSTFLISGTSKYITDEISKLLTEKWHIKSISITSQIVGTSPEFNTEFTAFILVEKKSINN